MPLLLLKLTFDQVEHQPMPFLINPFRRLITGQVKRKLIQPQLIQHLDFLESEVRESLRFANDQFTAADIQMSFPVEVAVVPADLNVSRRKLMKFLDLIHARPAYQ